MLRRLFMALLIACLAVPAAAAPLDQTEVAGHGAAASCHGKEAPAPQQLPAAAAKHECIGCVPPASAVAALDPPFEVRGQVAVTYLAQPLPTARPAPDTPPPKA